MSNEVDGGFRVPRRDELGGLPGELLNRGNARNPDVWLRERGDVSFVVKDFAPRAPWVRATLGRWIAAREARAWERLSGHTAVPRFLGRIDALAFAVEYRPGHYMTRALRGKIPGDFVDRLEVAVAEMHEAGVVHLDLSHRSNVLVDDAGAPIVIDFGSAVVFEPGSLAARTVMPLLARIDGRALAKWRRKLG